MLHTITITTPVGMLSVVCDEFYGSIHKAFFSTKSKPSLPSDENIQTAMALKIKNEINAYFCDPQHELHLPRQLQGSEFQCKIWNYLATIPAGQTKTYGEVAKIFHTSPRAVGQACKKNPIVLFIPCHRVTAKNHLGGYAGKEPDFLNIKEQLLKHENFSLKEVNCSITAPCVPSDRYL